MPESLIAALFLLIFIVVAIILCAIGVGVWRLIDTVIEQHQNRQLSPVSGRNGPPTFARPAPPRGPPMLRRL